MIIVRIAVCTFLVTSIFSRAQSTNKHGGVSMIINQAGEPSNILLELCSLLDIEHSGTLESIVAATQKAWLRPAGTERWEFADLYDAKRDQIMPLLEGMNCINDIVPSQKSYDYALMLGATAHRVRTRLAYLVRLWEKGVRFKHIIFATGARNLDPIKESEKELLTSDVAGLPVRPEWSFSGNLPTTETEMMKLVYEQSVLPDSMREVPVVFVDTPMQATASGQLRRPNTGDTIIHWLATSPSPGRCLVVSNQPFTAYQDTVVKTFVPKGFTVETVGHEACENISIAVCLDSIARWLYQEQKRRLLS